MASFKTLFDVLSAMPELEDRTFLFDALLG